MTGADDARDQTDDLQESQEDLAAASERSAETMNGFAGTISGMGERAGMSARATSVLDNSVRLLSSTATFAVGSLASFVGSVTGISVASGTATGAVTGLTGALSGLTISGVVGSVTGALSGFVGWLAAGSAGALAFAGAVGTGLGLLGVFALEASGALNAVQRFGRFVGNILPPQVRDGLLQIVSIAAGPLAVLGSMIVGFFRDGWQGAIQAGKKTIGIFVGAWSRQVGRIKAIWSQGVASIRSGWNSIKADGRAAINTVRTRFQNGINQIRSGFAGLRDDVSNYLGSIGSAAASRFRSGFNSVIPSSIDIPSASVSLPDAVGGGSVTVGGGSFNLPQLQTGGMVGETGIAEVHKGESVIPRPLVEAAESGGGGGGGGDVVVESVSVSIDGGDFDPSNMSRRELESFASRVAKAIGRKTNTTAGMRG